MRFLFRTLAYSAGLFFVLGYASYRLYKDPSQVEARLGRSLSQFLTTQARIEGCDQPFLGTLSARRIEIPAAPAIAERNVLELEDVKVEDTSSRRAFRYRKAAEPQAAPPTVHASRGVLRLDHEVAASAGGLVDRWSFFDLLKTEAALEILAGEHAHVLVDRLEVQLQDLRPPRKEIVFRIEARDVEARHAEPDGVVMEADLAEGEHWSSGQIEVSWTRAGGLRFRGGADDVRSPERWLPLLSDEDRELWDDFRPAGSFNIDVEELRVATDGKVALRATVRHYDTSVRLGTTGLELRHVSGPMVVTESEVRIGKDAAGQSVSADLLGISVEAEGLLSARQGELKLQLASAPLETILASTLTEHKPALSSLVALLRPRGSLGGELDVAFRRREKPRVSGGFRLSETSLGGVPFVSGMRGSVSFEQLDAEPGAQGSNGKLVLEEADFAGLGTARGEVRFWWGDSGLRLEFSDLKVARAGLSKPASSSADEPGCIFASAAWSWEAGLTAVDVRWLGVPLAMGILAARSVGGSFKRTAEAQPGAGVLELERVTVPAALLWPQCDALEFQGGKCRFRFEEGQSKRFALTSFKLSGEGKSLRAAGTVALSGEVDLVIFLNQGPTHAAFDRLPDDTTPADWKEAAKASYRAFHITGSLRAPSVREIGALDPVFVRPR